METPSIQSRTKTLALRKPPHSQLALLLHRGLSQRLRFPPACLRYLKDKSEDSGGPGFEARCLRPLNPRWRHRFHFL